VTDVAALTQPVAGVTLSALRRLDGWSQACERLRALDEQRGEQARKEAEHYGDVYKSSRAAMLFDVVYSRRRGYRERVLPKVEAFCDQPGAASLMALKEHGVGSVTGLRQREEQTMRDVAGGLLRYARDVNLEENDEEAICRGWARDSDVGAIYGLDPYVGKVNGIALALFQYLRMRCGADTTKPDGRVGSALESLGFPVHPRSQHQVFAVTMGAAVECGLRPLVVDQLLWWIDE